MDRNLGNCASGLDIVRTTYHTSQLYIYPDTVFLLSWSAPQIARYYTLCESLEAGCNDRLYIYKPLKRSNTLLTRIHVQLELLSYWRSHTVASRESEVLLKLILAGLVKNRYVRGDNARIVNDNCLASSCCSPR